MIRKTKGGYYLSEKLKRQSGLIHGFSTKKFGDCDPLNKSNWQNISQFLTTLGLKRENLVLMEQVHGRKIKKVGKKDRGRIIPGVDGLVTSEKGLILGIKTADCLPILLVDSRAKIIGAVHAGWQGVFKKIPQKMIELMIKLGSLPEDILVAIGPYIRSCCYNISVQREKRFEKEFGSPKGMIIKRRDKTNLDLSVPTVIQLIHSGVLKKNIDLTDLCTACREKEFFSYRREGEKSGRMLSVINLV
jgi:YfiH family protein